LGGSIYGVKSASMIFLSMLLKKWIQKNKITFLLIIILLDFCILFLGYFFGEKNLFNLDIESNLPTLYQGLKIILVSFLSFDLFLLTKEKNKYFWLFLSFAFLFLGLDEVGQIHENIPTFLNEIFFKSSIPNPYDYVSQFGYQSTTWLPYYIPFLLTFFVIVGVFLIRFFKNYWKKAVIFVSGVFLLVLSLFVEYVNTKPHIMFQQGYNTYVFWEEAFEILGISLILYFVYMFFRESVEQLKSQYSQTKKKN